MKKYIKIIISSLLVLALMIGVGTIAFAEENTSNKLTIISSNVAGLPIPSKFDKDGKVVPKTQKIMGEMLNNSGIDIICVQEDFQYHAILAKQMTNYPYQTYTSGGVPVGDGLNIFSKYPIYNIERVEWEAYNGILDAANDGLTPKGFLKCTVDFNGVLVDVYDTHLDANGSLADCAAKKAQLEQLKAYINENSKDMPVVITGDMNIAMHCDINAEFYPVMIENGGFKDAWSEYCNDGVYFTERLSSEVNAEYEAKFGGNYWGRWDSVERVVYRSSSNVELTPTDFRYEDYNNRDGHGVVTDHSVMICELEVAANDYVAPAIDLNEQQKEPLADRIARTIKLTARCIYRILTDLIAKIKSGEITIK